MPQPRTCPPLVSRLAAALVAAATLTAGTSLGQARRADPVEEFRQAFLQERNVRNDDKAALAYRTAIQLKPDLVEAHPGLGHVLRALGKPAEAVAAFRAAIKLKPAYAQAHHGLGTALKHQGRDKEAETSFRAADRLKAGDR